MDDDILRTIRDFPTYIEHYQTSNVPNRAEINYTQKLNYPAIMNEILKTGFKSKVVLKFIPKNANKI